VKDLWRVRTNTETHQLQFGEFWRVLGSFTIKDSSNGAVAVLMKKLLILLIDLMYHEGHRHNHITCSLLSFFEDVTDKAGVNMDNFWRTRTKLNAGTHTFGASFTVLSHFLSVYLKNE